MCVPVKLFRHVLFVTEACDINLVTVAHERTYIYIFIPHYDISTYLIVHKQPRSSIILLCVGSAGYIPHLLCKIFHRPLPIIIQDPNNGNLGV